MSTEQPKNRGQGTDGFEGEDSETRDSRRIRDTEPNSAKGGERSWKVSDLLKLILAGGGLACAGFVLLVVGSAWIAAHYRHLLTSYEMLLLALIAILVVACPIICSVYRKGLITAADRVKRLGSRLAVLFGLLLVAIAGSWLYTWFTSPVSLKVGPETTFVEGPLRKDGTVDYLAAINQRASKEVTPENNALAGIAKLIPPEEWESEAVRNRVFQKLGVKKPGTNAVFFESFETYAENRAESKKPGPWGEKVKPDSRGRSNSRFGHRHGSDIPRPKTPRWEVEWDKAQKLNETWSEEDFPLVAEWLAAREKALERLRTLARRNRSRWPYVAPGSEDRLVAAADFSHLKTLKSMAMALRLRALKRLPEGQPNHVIKDVLTMKHLVRHLRDAPVLLEQLLGIEVATKTSDVIAELVEEGDFGGQQARELRKPLAAVSGRFDLARCINVWLRFRTLDTLQRLPQGDIRVKRPDLPTDRLIESPLVERLVDRNEAMKRANRFYNRVVEAMRNPLYSPNINLDDKMMQYQADLFPPSFWRGIRLVFGHRGEITDVAYERTLTHMVPAVSAAVARAKKVAMRGWLERAALSLAGYHAQNGRYPESLEVLIPKWLDKVPRDILAPEESKAIQYRLEDERVAVYSVGENEKDDGGMQAEDEDEGDLVIQWDRSDLD